MGARGPFLQHRESRGIELVDHIAHGLVVAAQQPSNRRGSFPARRCSQDLAATHHKGIGRTQSRLDLVLFVLGERSDKNGCSHTSYCTTFPTTSGGIALAMAMHPSVFLLKSRACLVDGETKWRTRDALMSRLVRNKEEYKNDASYSIINRTI